METKRKILVKYRNGEKIRQISREAQISRNTIRGIVRNKEQIKEGYERKVQPYPALGEYIGKLEKILRENKNTKPKPTNRHVYEEIVLQGYKGSYSTISRYITDIPHELRVNFLFVKFLNEKIFLPKILQHFHFKIA